MSSHPQAQFFDAPALLVEARFRGRPLASRLLRAQERRGFAVGAARGADAPIDRAFVLATPGNDNHVLVQPSGTGFLVNLSPAMRACSEETSSHLRVSCGEVVFDLHAAAAAPAVSRPWLSSRAKDLLPYLAGVAAATTLLLVMLHMVPPDPRALSLDDLGRSARLGFYLIKPPVVLPPPAAARGPSGGGAPTVASGPSGAAGDRRARSLDGRRATRGPAKGQSAPTVEQVVRDSSIFVVLDGPRSRTLTQVFAPSPAFGGDPETVLGHLEGREFGDAYGIGLGPKGTGPGGADTGKPLIGGAPSLGTIGRSGGTNGFQRAYGDQEGTLTHRKPRDLVVEVTPPIVRGGLDKEIVRRVVRRHLNEVRYCYESSLARRPSLAGRVVTSFTIAPTGVVLASLLQSSTLDDAAVESCIVGAIRRWEFPRPQGGGVVVVSYPFQLAPAGG